MKTRSNFNSGFWKPGHSYDRPQSVREAHVYCEVHSCEVTNDFIRDFNPKGIILSGSHMSAYEESTDVAPAAVFELEFLFSASVTVCGSAMAETARR